MRKKIILNVPHASVEGVFDRSNGWTTDIPVLQQQVKRWTDWFTDFLFSSDNPDIIMKRCELSRFVVDVERLDNDPMEKYGQGIIYTEFEKIRRTLKKERKAELTKFYYTYRSELGELITGEEDVLIDCHSFPSDLNQDIDICLGYNEDWSKPSEKFLKEVQSIFKRHQFKAEFNVPYSNSITPDSPIKYKSFMIEINKHCYMNEKLIELKPDDRLHKAIDELYSYILYN